MPFDTLNPDRPSPVPDEVSAPFFAGLAEGELRVQTCADCGLSVLAEHVCPRCHGERLHWRAASGCGRLHSFTILHLAYDAAFAGELPYAAAVVELEEGPRLFAAVLGIDPGNLELGMALKCEAATLSSGVAVPAFRADPPPGKTVVGATKEG